MPGYVLGGGTGLSPAKLAARYGTRWLMSQPQTRLTRLYDSAAIKVTPSVGGTAGQSGFDSLPIYKDIKLCNLVDGQVTAYYGEPGFTRTPATGDVMVEIPRYYYRIEDIGTMRNYLISDYPLDGYEISPRHAPHEGKPGGYDKIYVSAYELSNGYRSISGVAPLTGQNRIQVRAGCRDRGIGYHSFDIATYWTIVMLYIIEAANWDSQAAVGAGYTSADGITPVAHTGGSDNVAGHTGRADGNSTAALNSAKYRHMENLWGNTSAFCDGIIVDGQSVYICTDPSKYAEATDDYTLLSCQAASSSGWIKALGYDPSVPWAQICTDAGGADGSYIPDLYTPHDNYHAVLIGGKMTQTSAAGLLSIEVAQADYSYSYIGSRLIYLPGEG